MVETQASFQEWGCRDRWGSRTHVMHYEQELRTGKAKDDERTQKEKKEQCVRVVCQHMAHEGTLVRMPPLLDDEINVPFISGSRLKEKLVLRVVDEYFFHVRTKAAEWLQQKVEKEGVMFLEPLLKKQEIFEIRDKSGYNG